MKRVLLIGRDPLFAWALEKKIAALGYHVEHIYTLAEATLRVKRFHYELFLLDGLAGNEMESFLKNNEPEAPVFVLEDTGEERPGNHLDLSGKTGCRLSVPKESALQSILSSLEKLS